MPCSEIADSIVAIGKETLLSAINLIEKTDYESFTSPKEINSHSKSIRENCAKVIYGDTDSMFVLLEGKSPEEAFILGKKMAEKITNLNPEPIKLQFEKIYFPFIILSKKHYSGYKYKDITQLRKKEKALDSKGIETVRRDTCEMVGKILGKSISILFETKNLSALKEYLAKQIRKINSQKTILKEFIIAKEVRLGTYRSNILPPSAQIAYEKHLIDNNYLPRFKERIPYLVILNDKNSKKLKDCIISVDVFFKTKKIILNTKYYIEKLILPAVGRILEPIKVDVFEWYQSFSKFFLTSSENIYYHNVEESGINYFKKDSNIFENKNILPHAQTYDKIIINSKEHLYIIEEEIKSNNSQKNDYNGQEYNQALGIQNQLDGNIEAVDSLKFFNSQEEMLINKFENNFKVLSNKLNPHEMETVTINERITNQNSYDLNNLVNNDNDSKSKPNIMEMYSLNVFQTKLDDFFRHPQSKYSPNLNQTKKSSFFKDSKYRIKVVPSNPSDNSLYASKPHNSNIIQSKISKISIKNMKVNGQNNSDRESNKKAEDKAIETIAKKPRKKQIQMKFQKNKNLKNSENEQNDLFHNENLFQKIKLERFREVEILKYNHFIKHEFELNYENSLNLLLANNNHDKIGSEDLLFKRKNYILDQIKINTLWWKRNELERICRFCSSFNKFNIDLQVPCSNYQCKIFYEKKLFD